MRPSLSIEDPPEYKIPGAPKANPVSIEQVLEDAWMASAPPSLRKAGVTVGLDLAMRERLGQLQRVLSKDVLSGEV